MPSHFEMHEGVEFAGVGIYRRSIQDVAVPDGRRAILQFQAAATLAEVITEMLIARTSERQGRVIDHDGDGSMEDKKKEGYF